MLKILHIADLHLDSRFVGLNHTEAAKHRAEMREIFKNALELAKKEGCSVTLISGDLFDGVYYTSDTLRFLAECFKSMPEHKFIISPGNHDPYTATSPYRFAEFPENVFVFDSEKLSSLHFDDLSLTVYGYAFTSSFYGERPLDGFESVENSEDFTVLCAHTELDTPVSSYAPISTAELAESGFDYAALGHIHTCPEIGTALHTVYAYSGCIGGRDFTEHGEKGGIIVSLDKKDGKKTAEAKRVALCPWIYESVSVSLDGCDTQEQINEAITKKIKQYQKTPETEYFIQIKFTGSVSCEIDTEQLTQKFSPLGVRSIKDETVASFSYLELEYDFSLRGEYYRKLKPMLLSSDREERKKASLALKYGLCALNSGEIEI